MEHIIVKQLKSGYFRLTPEAGYLLVSTLNNKTYSEAVVKEVNENEFRAIEKEG